MEFPTRAIADLYQARYALIRPDQHVAWRGPSLASFRSCSPVSPDLCVSSDRLPFLPGNFLKVPYPMLPKRSIGLAEMRVAWCVLVGAAAAMMVSVSGLQHYTVDIFVEPLTHQFGTTRSALGLWSLCLLGGLAIASPLAGWVIDRR